jgi:hypothetical protein
MYRRNFFPKKYVILYSSSMKRIVKITSLALIILSLFATSCASSKKGVGAKGGCGCKGMVGY